MRRQKKDIYIYIYGKNLDRQTYGKNLDRQTRKVNSETLQQGIRLALDTAYRDVFLLGVVYSTKLDISPSPLSF